MSRSAPQRKAERQRTILEAAIRAFSRQGYHGCTVAQVAREAGMADGTLYLYFQGKEDLLISAFRFVLEGLLERLDRATEQEADPIARLQLLVELHLGMMEADRELASFLQFQLRQPDEAIRHAIAEPLTGYARRIEAILDQGKEVGMIRPDISTRVMRRVIFGAVDETVSAWLLHPESGTLSTRAGPLLEVLLRGVTRPGPAPAP
ncbi:MAG TPA: TetR/AcrR family transcriptional regulator [Deferrisomatales bacterium]|nr:TetR/AcrR family transcriptional regulator [Deferrisomatales bacterium]